jgi:hypothetical protein
MVVGVGIAGAVFSSALSMLGENMVTEAVHYGFLVAAGVALTGMIVSSTRGNAVTQAAVKPL